MRVLLKILLNFFMEVRFGSGERILFQHGCGFKIGRFSIATSLGVSTCFGFCWSDIRREFSRKILDGTFARAVENT